MPPLGEDSFITRFNNFVLVAAKTKVSGFSSVVDPLPDHFFNYFGSLISLFINKKKKKQSSFSLIHSCLSGTFCPKCLVLQK